MPYSPTHRTDSTHAAATARSLPVRGLTAAQRFTAVLDAEDERTADQSMTATVERLAQAYADRIMRESAIDRARLGQARP